jgi:hypothetical protein
MALTKAQWLGLIKLIVPPVVAIAVPGAGPVLAGVIIQGIEVAENTGQPGHTKLQTAKDEIATVAQGINAAKPGTIDIPQLNAVVDSVINTSVGAANLVKNVPVHTQTP